MRASVSVLYAMVKKKKTTTELSKNDYYSIRVWGSMEPRIFYKVHDGFYFVRETKSRGKITPKQHETK